MEPTEPMADANAQPGETFLAAEPAGPGAGIRCAQAGFAYFAIMLAVALVLAPVRDLLVLSGADPVMAYLGQGSAMLFGLIWAAGWVAATFSIPAKLSPRLALGFGAVGALLASDILAFALHSSVAPLDFSAPRRAARKRGRGRCPGAGRPIAGPAPQTCGALR